MRRHRITKKYAAQFIEMLKRDIETEAFTPNEEMQKFLGEMKDDYIKMILWNLDAIIALLSPRVFRKHRDQDEKLL